MQIQITDDAALGVYPVKMKTNCLAYLHSFQILNKLLIKILFFPRESAVNGSSSSGAAASLGAVWKADNDDEENQRIIVSLIAEFEDWIKDLFVISCTSFIPSPNNGNCTKNPSKIFYRL